MLSTRAVILLAFAALPALSPRTLGVDVPNPSSEVLVRRVPEGGIQPEAAIDSRGVLHLLYFAGEPAGGDLFYVRSNDLGATFSTPIRVNSQPGSAIATGTIRGGQLALGRNGRIHVAWNGSDRALPRGAINPDLKKPGAPFLYARSTADGAGFEPQRNLNLARLLARWRRLDRGGRGRTRVRGVARQQRRRSARGGSAPGLAGALAGRRCDVRRGRAGVGLANGRVRLLPDPDPGHVVHQPCAPVSIGDELHESGHLRPQLARQRPELRRIARAALVDQRLPDDEHVPGGSRRARDGRLGNRRTGVLGRRRCQWSGVGAAAAPGAGAGASIRGWPWPRRASRCWFGRSGQVGRAAARSPGRCSTAQAVRPGRSDRPLASGLELRHRLSRALTAGSSCWTQWTVSIMSRGATSFSRRVS